MPSCCRALLPSIPCLALAAVLLAGATPEAALAQQGDDSPPPSTLLCPDALPEGEFVDRQQISVTHRPSVDCLAYLGVTLGLGSEEGNHYLPDADVRRGQMASFIVRSLRSAGADLPSPVGAGFDDVHDDAVHASEIRQLARAGITQGTSADDYSPSEPVTREAMASFLLRTVAWYQGRDLEALAGGPTPFDDIEATTHAASIAGAYHLGIAQGVNSDVTGANYAPRHPVTRAQMASFLTATTAALLDDPGGCSNRVLGYTLQHPEDWHTNVGIVEPHCTHFDRQRFVVEPGTETPASRPVQLHEVDLGYEEAASMEGGEQISRRSVTVGGRDAIVRESTTTESSHELLPAGVQLYRYFIDLPDDRPTRTLLASTASLADGYDENRRILDEMMTSLEFAVPERIRVAAFQGGGRPFEVVAFAPGTSLCTQAQAGGTVDTVCVERREMEILALRSHEIDDDFVVHVGSVEASIDHVEVETGDGEVVEPSLVTVGGRLVYTVGIDTAEIAMVRASRGGETVATVVPTT